MQPHGKQKEKGACISKRDRASVDASFGAKRSSNKRDDAWEIGNKSNQTGKGNVAGSTNLGHPWSMAVGLEQSSKCRLENELDTKT